MCIWVNVRFAACYTDSCSLPLGYTYLCAAWVLSKSREECVAGVQVVVFRMAHKRVQTRTRTKTRFVATTKGTSRDATAAAPMQSSEDGVIYSSSRQQSEKKKLKLNRTSCFCCLL